MKDPTSRSVTRYRTLAACIAGLFAASFAFGQATATPSGSTAPGAPGPDEEVIVLSPFEVSAGEDVGYYATHTLAGTRMNSSLADIPGSITVITKAQLEDTGSLDINDVFLYEANTEGIHTYTEFTLDRYGSATDYVQIAPEGANRVRGIGRADVSRDYFVGINGIPFDSYNVDRLTLNRGPNSVLYGLGSPSGLVNSSPAQANIGVNSTHLEFRVGSWDALRASFNVNATLIDDKLAVRFSGLYDDRGVKLQPAYEKNRRLYAAVTFRPFRTTNIRASYERYEQERQAANAVTPADLITPWIEAGRPMWNPLTFTATYEDGTQVTSTSTSTSVIQELMPGVRPDEHLSRPFWVMDQGRLVGSRLQRRLGNSGTLNLDESLGLVDIPGYFTGASRVNQAERLFFSDSVLERNLAYPGYIAPGLQDKSLYDWSSINISAANIYESKANIYQLKLEQQIIEDLHLELAVHREEMVATAENGINANQAKVYIDVNTHYLDGTVNPWAGMPFIESRQEVDANVSPQELTIMRATMAYNLDFTKSDGWARWLGRHNIMGLLQQSST